MASPRCLVSHRIRWPRPSTSSPKGYHGRPSLTPSQYDRLYDWHVLLSGATELRMWQRPCISSKPTTVVTETLIAATTGACSTRCPSWDSLSVVPRVAAEAAADPLVPKCEQWCKAAVLCGLGSYLVVDEDSSWCWIDSTGEGWLTRNNRYLSIKIWYLVGVGSQDISCLFW
jgi:hypothetical protein